MRKRKRSARNKLVVLKGVTIMEEISVLNERYRLGYHLMAKGGWINDPNGLSFFKGYYHVFYQFYPYASEWGPMHWGHARSKDLVHWETLPIALFPDDKDDGCFSGSAIVHDGKLWLIYTGHHYIDEENDIFYEDQNLAYSTDGIHFTKYEKNPVLKTPTDNTKHFRDPKVWQDGDNFYMVLGSQGEDGLGRALLYQSKDLLNWKRLSVLDKAKNLESEGYMWECPDYFRINGYDILLMSPQGLTAQGELYRNLNQTGYLLGQLQANQTLMRNGFKEIDNGHDFYATQTLLTPDGRRVMIAWMNAWDSPMYEKQDGWAGALTIPRELTVHNKCIYQNPVKEIKLLRQEKVVAEKSEEKEYALSSTSEIILQGQEIADGKVFTITDGKNELTLTKSGLKLYLDRTTKDGQRSGYVLETKQWKFQIFVDKSSVEVFVNNGELTFTERMYWQGNLTLEKNCTCNIRIYRLETHANKY